MVFSSESFQDNLLFSLLHMKVTDDKMVQISDFGDLCSMSTVAISRFSENDGLFLIKFQTK